MNPILRLREQARRLSKQQNLRLKDALNAVAQEQGHPDWKTCKDALDTFWYPKMSAFLNHWFANYKEAQQHQKQFGGYLLTYKGQYFVASEDYVQGLGFDPKDPVWLAVNYDLSSSNSLEKFHRYYGKVSRSG